jgi:hypothetical protein
MFAALGDGPSFDLAACCEDAVAASEVDIGRREVVWLS